MDGKFNKVPDTLEESQTRIHHVSRPGISTDEVMKIYDQWAGNYDQDMSSVTSNGTIYLAQETARLFENKHYVHILDAACGTGRAAQQLVKQGFIHIDGLDGSSAMIEEAKTKNIYENVYVEYLGPNKLTLSDNTYDAVVTTDSFAPGHLKDDCFEEIIRILKPGGYFVLVMGDKYFRTDPGWTKNIEPHMQELEDKKQWKKITRRAQKDYMLSRDTYGCIVFVMQKNKQE